MYNQDTRFHRNMIDMTSGIEDGTQNFFEILSWGIEITRVKNATS